MLLKSKNHHLSKLIQNKSNLIGIRIPDHSFTIKLVKKILEPIITTSVNMHGEKPLLDIENIEKQYPKINKQLKYSFFSSSELVCPINRLPEVKIPNSKKIEVKLKTCK